MNLHMLWDNNALTMVNPPEKVEKFLHISEKRMAMVYDEQKKRDVRKTVYDRRPLFNVICEGSAPDKVTGLRREPRVLQTYQGLWHKVKKIAEKEGFQVVLHDKRMPLKPPELHRMHGFRYSQRELLCNFLIQQKSGLLGAPTRWGKTTLLINTLRAFPGVTTVVTVPGVDLVRQLYKEVKEKNPDRDVVLLGAGSRKRIPSEDITVVSMDSLHLCDKGRVKLILIDEPHTAVTESRLREFVKFNKARLLGFGATLEGRFDGRDKLIEGLIGPPLAVRTYPEAVAEGAICPLVVLFLRCGFNGKQECHSRDAAYNKLLFRNKSMASLTSRICHDIIPDAWQTLLFISNEKQALLYLDKIGRKGTIAMAKRLKVAERRDLMEQMQAGTVKRCLASNIYAQGVTFSDVRVLINLAGGGNNTTAIQKPGRLAEVRPDKPCGIVIDTMFAPDNLGMKEIDEFPSSDYAWRQVVADSQARRKAYTKKGYIIRDVGSFDELKAAFREFENGTAVELKRNEQLGLL